MPLPLVRTAELQLSMSFSNLAVPAVGGMAAQVRFLQKQGIDLASAVAAGGLLATVGNIAAQILLLVVALALAPTQLDLGKIDTDSVVQVVVIIAAAIVVASGGDLRGQEDPRQGPAAGQERAHDDLGGAAFTASGCACSSAATSSTRSCTRSCSTRASSRSADTSTTGRC